MKIKTLLVFTLLASLSFSVSSKGKGDMGDEGWMVQMMTRMSFRPSITTNIDNSDIEIFFNSNLGIVNILIKNNRGIAVIKRTVDTTMRDNLQLNISNLPADSYIIEFIDSKGIITKTGKFSTH